MEHQSLKNLKNGSYIIVLQNESNCNEIIDEICSDRDIKIFDKHIVDSGKNPIKILDVRKAKEKLSLKPQGKFVLMAFVGVDQITTQAVNAMLKILEEPPKHAIIVLFSNNQNSLLPTILSRCKKILIRGNDTTDIDKYTLNIYREVKSCQYASDKIKIAAKLNTDKADTRDLLIKWMKGLRKSRDMQSMRDLKIISNYAKQYKIGVNQKLFLENLFLEI